MDIKFSWRMTVLQPTTLCNLDCSYCYLGLRNKNLLMPPLVAQRVADAIRARSDLAHLDASDHISIIWHGGEPTACPLAHFEQLVAPFADLVERGCIGHYIQTNATLITKQWCDFFTAHKFRVGISVDGPSWATTRRVNWGQKEAFPEIMRGAQCLKEAGIDFTTIAVISGVSLQRAKELYEFFLELGCSSLGINLEEKEGLNVRDVCDDDHVVNKFWKDLFAVWKKNPRLRIREFSEALGWMNVVCSDSAPADDEKLRYNIFPIVGFNGDVTLLSPELLGAKSEMYGNFIVGNVLRDKFSEMLARGPESRFVQEYVAGVQRCHAECDYFSFCHGGQASNKFYEFGRFDVTENTYCRNTKKRLINAVLQSL